MATRRFSRRWLLVGAGAAALVGVGAVSLPATPVSADPAALRDRIRKTVPPYIGYAESNGRLGLPEIPRLESVVGLLTGTTRMRAFVASADAWRADELTPTGEHGVYRAGSSEFLWDFEANQLTRVLGIAAARLPRAADLLPPDLARRLLALAGTDPVTPLPSRRIAGRDAAGLRVTPADPQTTVGSVDIWADPTTALPLRVEVAGRTGPALLTTELLEVTDGPPDPSLLRPLAPPGAGNVTAEVLDVAGALKVLNAPPPPASLVGRPRLTLPGTPLPGVGVYGTGLAAFVLVPTSRDIAEQAVNSAAAAGGYPITVVSGRAARVTTPLLSVAVRTRGRTGSLLLGATDPLLLDKAIAELPARGAHR